MSLSFRAFLIAAFAALAVYFLWPSWVYYFDTPAAVREKVESGGILTKGAATDADAKALERAGAAKTGAVSLGLDIRGGIMVVIDADYDKLAEAMKTNASSFDAKFRMDSIDRVLQKVQNRIDEFGLSEVSIRKQGDSRLVVQIPGERDTTRIKSIIDRVGRLEFKLVDEEGMRAFAVDPATKEPLSTNVPAGSEVVWLWAKNPETLRYERGNPLLLKTNVMLTGDRVRDARPAIGRYGEVEVAFSLDGEGAKIFGDVTGRNTGTRLAIVLDGKVMTAPNINSRIGAEGVITGNFSQPEAKDLSIILRSGSLPVPVKLVSEEVIGPSMGREALAKSITALFVSLLVILVFMMLRYRLIGVIATAALALNGLLIFAILAPLHFTVSLPGIAGLILTLGMAIDANVLINERIRDELYGLKRPLFDAIQKGYDRAFWTIIDSHVTGLISAFVLANFGEGPVKGFAVTLFIGITVSLFTALFVTRFLVDVFIRWRWIRPNSKIAL